ncbi:MAG: hypothetical protein Q4F83_02645 [Eubacteriales bacterium]|nr:hypothetical protein [Eubacteriales bacterium]
MAKYREVPCKYYIALGQCKKGREAVHKKYCQHCEKYYPRAKVRNINKKRTYNEKMRASSGKDGAFGIYKFR